MKLKKTAAFTLLLITISIFITIPSEAFVYGKELKNESSVTVFTSKKDSLNGISDTYIKYRYDDNYTLYYYIMCNVDKTDGFKEQNCRILFSFSERGELEIQPQKDEIRDFNTDEYAAHIHTLLSVQDIGIQFKSEGTITFKQVLTAPLEVNITIYDGEGINSKTKKITFNKTFEEETTTATEENISNSTEKPPKTTVLKTTVPKTTKAPTTKKVTTEKITTVISTRKYPLATNAVTSSAVKPKVTKSKSTTTVVVESKTAKVKKTKTPKEETTIQIVVNVIMPTESLTSETETETTVSEKYETTNDEISETTEEYNLTDSSKVIKIKKILLFSGIILTLMLVCVYVIYSGKRNADEKTPDVHDNSTTDDNN